MDFLCKKFLDFDNVQNICSQESQGVARFTRWFIENSLLIIGNPDETPSKPLNDLAELTWQLIGKNIVPVAFGGVPTITMCIEIRRQQKAAAMIFPQDIQSRMKKEGLVFLGGMVYNASKARDYYNNQVFDIKAFECRAMAYEAEFLRILKKQEIPFNDYQEEVLKKFPNGLNSLPAEYSYEGKKFDAETAEVSPLWVSPFNVESN